MVINDIQIIPKKDKETEYDLIPNRDRTITIKRHNIGLQFEAELSFEEYYWIFGDRRQDKFNIAFEAALYEFIREEFNDDDEEEE